MQSPLLVCSLLAAGLCASLAAAPAQSNPILPNADPYITRNPVDGRYLLLATTGDNITVWSGPTVPGVTEQKSVVFTPRDGLAELWSPTLWKEQGRWWIYFTARSPGREHAIYALQSNTADPLGTYTFRGEVKLQHPAIDASLLTVNGKTYLMYAGLDGSENAIRIVHLAAPMQPVGADALIAQPTYPWEKGAGTVRNYPVNEGPTALYHGGHTFVVYSASDTASPRYCLGLLTFRGGDPLHRRNWLKTPHPVFGADPANSIYGPGRGTFAEGPHGSWWLLYAAKATDDPTPRNRATRAQRFTWNVDGTPNFGSPSRDGPIPRP